MPAAPDGVSHPPHQRQYQADDQEDEPEDQNDMCEGEGRDEAGENEPEDDKDDSKNDHDVYQFLRRWLGGWFPRSASDGVFGFTADGLAVGRTYSARPFTARPSRVSSLEFQAERGEWANRNRNVRREQRSSSSAAYSQTLSGLAEGLSNYNTTPLGEGRLKSSPSQALSSSSHLEVPASSTAPGGHAVRGLQ